MSKSTLAVNTLKLSKSPDPSSSRLLVADAAKLCSTRTGRASSTLSEGDAVRILMCLVLELQRNVLSGDLWWLAWDATERQMLAMGMDPNLIQQAKQKLEDERLKRKDSNPMHGLFNPG